MEETGKRKRDGYTHQFGNADVHKISLKLKDHYTRDEVLRLMQLLETIYNKQNEDITTQRRMEFSYIS